MQLEQPVSIPVYWTPSGQLLTLQGTFTEILRKIRELNPEDEDNVPPKRLQLPTGLHGVTTQNIIIIIIIMV
jgi:hypothetical protein